MLSAKNCAKRNVSSTNPEIFAEKFSFLDEKECCKK